MSNFSKIIQSLSLRSSETRGKQFEIYCKWFLENDPRYKVQLKKIWLWNDWPHNWGRDKGIDLIAQAYDGSIWAIQAKAYDADYYVTKEDIDTFLSESSRKQISYRLLIATTNNIGPNAKEVMDGQEKKVGICNLFSLEESIVDWDDLLNKQSSKRVAKIPRPHQQKAIDDVLNGFQKSDKGQLYMACGTGKTLVGLWVAKQLNSQRTLVLVPSISLVAQLYREWVENAGLFEFDPLFVCSDETVSKKGEDEDKFVIQSSELGFPVTTNAQELNGKLAINRSRAKVVFSTYHSSPVIAQACALDSSLTFDIAIADEAHRCAGKATSDFATIVKDDLIRTQHKLFMTATPKIYSNQVKQKTKEHDYEIVSMDDDQSFGPIFHKLLFSDAIKQNLLTDYQVLISVMDNATYKEYAEKGRFVAFNNHETDARTLATQILIVKAINKLQLKKVITFHNKRKSARQFVQSFDKAIELMPENEQLDIAYKETIFGEMQQSQRKMILKGFQELANGKIGLIGNVKCLSEGIDVPAIDGIVFVDPKGSEIDIVQSVGRAIRKSDNKKMGTIIIPIFVDKITNEEEELEKSCFQVIWKVVKALRAHDDTLAEELDNIRLELGKQVYRKPAKLGKISVDLPIKIGSGFAEELELKIIDSIVKTFSLPWNYYFELIEQFVIKNGHSRIPKYYEVEIDGKVHKVGSWFSDQKKNFFNLSNERKAKLESLAMFIPRKFIRNENISTDEWIDLYVDAAQRLCTPLISNSHVEKDLNLGQWMQHIRKEKEWKKLSYEQKEKLLRNGFMLKPSKMRIEASIAALAQFAKREGHTSPGYGTKETIVYDGNVYSIRLDNFVKKLKYRDVELAKRCEYIPNFALIHTSTNHKKNDIYFEQGFLFFDQFVNQNLNPLIPNEYVLNNFNLSKWFQKCRYENENGFLNENLKQKVLSIDPIFFDDYRDRIFFYEVKPKIERYINENGHAFIPQNFITNEGYLLGEKISDLRERKKKLRPKIKSFLDSLGTKWTWNVFEAKNIKNAISLIDAIKKGPNQTKEINRKRKDFINGLKKYPSLVEYKNIIEGLIPEFFADPKDENWDALLQYVAREGHACPPIKQMESGKKIGYYVSRIRQKYKKNTQAGKILQDSVMFESLPGWKWDAYL